MVLPKTIKKDIRDLISVTSATEEKVVDLTKVAFNDLPKDEQQSIVDNMTSQMKAAC